MNIDYRCFILFIILFVVSVIICLSHPVDEKTEFENENLDEKEKGGGVSDVR